MEENTFWLKLWTAVLIALVCIITGAYVNSQMTNARMVEMVKAGASPMEAQCALVGPGNQALLCSQFAKGNK